MAKQETERKFLVKGPFQQSVTETLTITQGFLSTVPERTVRVRISNDKGYLTVKGIGNETGVSRYEFEQEIPLQDARDLLKICEPGIIEKIRHIIPVNNGLQFEVDEFFGANQGLIVAEIELPTEDTAFDKPDWLGREVTGDVRYYNAMLMQHPYTNW